MHDLLVFGQAINWIELAGMVTGIAGVWLTMKENVLCFPVGIINVSIYAWIFFSPGIRLYADALLQLTYVVLLAYGWYVWVVKKNRSDDFRPSRIKFSTALKLSAITIAGSILVSSMLMHYTDASLPMLDSTLACFSLAAQYMIARKLIENWFVWMAVNIAYLPMYLAKGLPLTAILYLVFFALAIRGYMQWKKRLTHA